MKLYLNDEKLHVGCWARLRLIWSRTHLIPGLPVPYFLSPWTNNPHKIDPLGQTSNFRLRLIWSRTHLVPGLLVPHFLSPWTNNPHKIDPPGQMVHNQFGPCISGSPQPVTLDKPKILGTICPGAPNWLGTICSWGTNIWGPSVHGDRICWELFVQRDQSIGDQLWGTKCLGTICVWDQMCHSLWVHNGDKIFVSRGRIFVGCAQLQVAS